MKIGQKRNLQILIGVLLCAAGLTSSIPLFLIEKFVPAIIGVVILLVGLVLIALGFGE